MLLIIRWPTSRSLLSLPLYFAQASRHPEWWAAMDVEHQALLENKTWILVLCPKKANVIGYKWVYCVKTRPDGSIEHLKARLVVH